MDFTMKGLIANFLLDLESYLSYIDDFERPNCKYFNFVLNKLGIMHIFLYKSKIFKNKTYTMIKFLDGILIALKKKFLVEKSNLRKSALIFLISKIYFTDDLATNLKLRIVKDEWEDFIQFFNNVRQDNEFQDVCIMFCHLYTENFFRFTIKSDPLALEYGDNQQTDCIDVTNTTIFWNELNDDVKKLGMTEITELKQLNEVRLKTIQHFENLIPEAVDVNEIFNDYESVQESLENYSKKSSVKKSRKEVLQVCKDYLKAGSSSRDNEEEIMFNPNSVISRKEEKAGCSSKSITKNVKQETSSDSENELDLLRYC